MAFLGLRNRYMLSILSGMVASVDIRTGKRSATCTILLKPIIKTKEMALQER